MATNSASPCMGCSDRAQGCHGKCERYGAWKEEHEKQRAGEMSERHKFGLYLAYMRDSAHRAKKARREREYK